MYEKAEWAKARCADELPYVDRLVHDRARDIVSLLGSSTNIQSRQSAQAELLGDLNAAEEGYEMSVGLLSTLLDDIMHEGNKLAEDDRLGFERREWSVILLTPVIHSINDRLEGVRRKIEALRH